MGVSTDNAPSPRFPDGTGRRRSGLSPDTPCLVGLAGVVAGAVLLLPGTAAHERFLQQPAALTIVHLTDLHLCSQPANQPQTPWPHRIIIAGYKLHRKRLDLTAALLAQAVQAINTRIRPDVVVITGDIVDQAADEAAYRKAAELLRGLVCPVIVVAGDHDGFGPGRPFNRWFGDSAGVVTVAEHRFISMPVTADQAALTKFGEEIAGQGSAPDPTIVCLHPHVAGVVSDAETQPYLLLDAAGPRE